MLQNINLYAFQNTEKKTESFDLIKLDTASNTSENQVGEKSKSKKFIVQKRKKKQKDSLNIGMYKISLFIQVCLIIILHYSRF